MRPSLIFLVLMSLSARAAQIPCRAKSPTLALIKNCFTGDMNSNLRSGPQFFGALTAKEDGANYCYNDFVLIEQNPSARTMQLRVLHDGRMGQIEELDYVLKTAELNANPSYFTLRGLSGRCFTPTGEAPRCASGWQTWIGVKDRDLPMTLALGRDAKGLFAVAQLVTDRKEIKARGGQKLHPSLQPDKRYAIYKTVTDIQHRLVETLHRKLSSIHDHSVSPKKLSETSEQFRFCTLALESYLKDKKMPDLMTAKDKRDLNSLTEYMNSSTRLPASQTGASRQLSPSKF